MPKDANTESSTVTHSEISDPSELFYAETTKAESSPAPEEVSSSVETSENEVEETASDSEPEITEESEPKPVAKPETPAERRIKQLLADNRKLQEQLRPKTEPKTDAPKTEAKVEELKAPEPGQFETWDLYQKAHVDYLSKLTDAKVKEAVERDRQERQKADTDAKQKAELDKSHKLMVDRQKLTEKRIPDLKAKLFDESGALREDIILHPVFDNFIPKSEVGWDVLHRLATDPELMAKVAEMDDFQAAGEFHRLQSEITAKIQTPPSPKSRPPRTVTGTTSTTRAKAPENAFYGDD